MLKLYKGDNEAQVSLPSCSLHTSINLAYFFDIIIAKIMANVATAHTHSNQYINTADR